MTTGDATRFTRILLTGPPGIGKTTICKQLIPLLAKQYSTDGFYTEEVRDSSKKRIGFDVVSIKNSEIRSPLARVANVLKPQEFQKHCVGNYHVFVENFEITALANLDSKMDLLFIDEIGKMELFSDKFFSTVNKLFFQGDMEKNIIIATIPQMHKVPSKYVEFFKKFYQDSRCKIIDVNRENRNILPKEIYDTICRISQKKMKIYSQ